MSASVISPAAPASEPFVISPFARAVLVTAIYAIVVLVTVRPIGEPLFDPDIWWHLRVGQWIVEHRAVTAHDPFSQVGLTKEWVAYSWLYEVLVFGLYQGFGLPGIILYRVVLSLLVVAAIHALVRRIEPRFLVATGLTLAATATLSPLFNERPWLVTILFATLTLRAILELRLSARPPWWVWTLPLAYVIWANIHIQFVYGLFLFFLAAVAPLVDTRLTLVPADDTATNAFSRGWKRLLALAALCSLATLVNPYGAKLYWVIVEYGSQPGPFRFVNELKGIEFRALCDWLVLAFTVAACFALGRRRVTAFELLLLAGTAVFAFRIRRDMWFLVLAALVILGTTSPRRDDDEQPGLTGKHSAWIAGALLGLAVFLAWTRDLSPAGLERRIANTVPVEAARVVRERGYAGPLFNDFNWGGYLIWALPELPVALDGRTNLHGDERLERYGRTWAGRPGWEDDEDLSRAGVVIAPLDAALTSHLRRDPRFACVHEDALAVVFVRRK